MGLAGAWDSRASTTIAAIAFTVVIGAALLAKH
jgi:hypothetical protein